MIDLPKGTLGRAIALAVLYHALFVGLCALLLLILQFLGISIPLLEAELPAQKPKELEFILTDQKPAPPRNPNTKLRAPYATRSGGVRDPKQRLAPAQRAAGAPVQSRVAPAAPARRPQPSASRVVRPTPAPVRRPTTPSQSATTPRRAPVESTQAPKPQAPPPMPTPVRPMPTPTPVPRVTPPGVKPPAVRVPMVPSPSSGKLPVGPVYSERGSGSGTASGSDSTGGSRSGSSSGRGVGPRSIGSATAGLPTGGGAGAASGSRGGGGDGGRGSYTQSGSSGGGGGAPGVDALPAPDFGPYINELQRRIRRNWNPPTADQSKRVVCLITIGRDGRLLGLRVKRSSGSASADQAAMAAVRASAPFRPLPANYRGNDVDVEFTFDYNVVTQQGSSYGRLQ